MTVLATSMPVTGTRAGAVETAEAIETAEAVETVEAVGTAEVGEDGDESENECQNLVRVPCIRYPITFQRSLCPCRCFLTQVVRSMPSTQPSSGS